MAYPAVPMQDLADVQKDLKGLQAPESSCLPPLDVANGKKSKDNNDERLAEEAESGESREILDHMVRLEFDIVPESADP